MRRATFRSGVRASTGCSGRSRARRRAPRAIGAALAYLAGRRGFLGDTVISTGGHFKTDPSLESADMKVSLVGAGPGFVRIDQPPEHPAYGAFAAPLFAPGQ